MKTFPAQPTLLPLIAFVPFAAVALVEWPFRLAAASNRRLGKAAR